MDQKEESLILDGEDMVVNSQDLYLLSHYEYGEAFYGSVSGMNYRVNRNPMEFVKFSTPEEKADATLIAYIWPGPKNFAKTDPEKIYSKEFPYSDEGKDELAAWISEQYESRKSEWDRIAEKGLLG